MQSCGEAFDIKPADFHFAVSIFLTSYAPVGLCNTFRTRSHPGRHHFNLQMTDTFCNRLPSVFADVKFSPSISVIPGHMVDCWQKTFAKFVVQICSRCTVGHGVLDERFKK